MEKIASGMDCNLGEKPETNLLKFQQPLSCRLLDLIGGRAE